MIILSLFDGMSCGRIALERAGIPVITYYSSEIDKYAIQIADKNYPQDTPFRLGDVTKIDLSTLPKIDLLIGGSPCQGFSFAGKQLNFNDPRSKLFFEFVKALEELKPRYFLLENVRMKKEYQDIITQYLGVEPILINSSLVSAQNRVRLYWTNIPNVTQPRDLEITLQDICEDIEEARIFITKEDKENINFGKWESQKSKDKIFKNIKGISEKGSCLCAQSVKPNADGVTILLSESYAWRKLTPLECERLQTVPDNYTEGVSNSQRYKMLGNGWTIDVISHILKFMK